MKTQEEIESQLRILDSVIELSQRNLAKVSAVHNYEAWNSFFTEMQNAKQQKAALKWVLGHELPYLNSLY